MRDRAAAGADVIKVFASTSIRFGGVTNLSAAQLEAACGEAHAQGLKAVVHLHRSDALRLAADAGCDQVEHGWLLEPADVGVFVESGMYLGNQIDLLFRNYEDNGDRFAGVGGYTMEGFANLQAARPGALEVFRRAAATPGVRIVYSTDANAGSHGANTDELVAYVEQGGQAPMDAVVSATSLAARVAGPRTTASAPSRPATRPTSSPSTATPSPTPPPWAASSSSCVAGGSTGTTRRGPSAEAPAGPLAGVEGNEPRRPATTSIPIPPGRWRRCRCGKLRARSILEQRSCWCAPTVSVTEPVSSSGCRRYSSSSPCSRSLPRWPRYRPGSRTTWGCPRSAWSGSAR